MSGVMHYVDASFLTALSTLTADGRGNLRDPFGAIKHPMIAVDRMAEWIIGPTGGITISEAALVELQGARANGDGLYTTVTGAIHALSLTSAGACEPGLPPPPRP